MSRERVLDDLASRIISIQIPHPVRVAIDGIDAAGKTTLADELADKLRSSGREIIRASCDSFHQPREIRYQKGMESPDGYYYDSFDYQAILSLLLIPLGDDGNRRCRIGIYDFRIEKPVETSFFRVADDAILLFDGIFLLRPELNSAWDYRIFIDIDFENSLTRVLNRDKPLFGSAENIKNRYLQRYFPGQRLYFRLVNPQTSADIIVDNRQPLAPRMYIPPK